MVLEISVIFVAGQPTGELPTVTARYPQTRIILKIAGVA